MSAPLGGVYFRFDFRRAFWFPVSQRWLYYFVKLLFKLVSRPLDGWTIQNQTLPGAETTDEHIDETAKRTSSGWKYIIREPSRIGARNMVEYYAKSRPFGRYNARKWCVNTEKSCRYVRALFHLHTAECRRGVLGAPLPRHSRYGYLESC